MADFQLIQPRNEKDWMRALSLCTKFDTYHLPGYHLLAQEQGEGDPYLFFFHDQGEYAALPFLIRHISEVAGLQHYIYMDATSVYGYPGIVSTLKENNYNAEDFRLRFQDSLMQSLEQLGVVALFSRLNPLISTGWLFRGIAEVKRLGFTVAIDLTKSETDQVKTMTKGHRYDIRKARKDGVTARDDSTFEHMEDFIRMYLETMSRTDAKDYYFFSKDYFYKLRQVLGDSLKLFIAEKGGVIVAASLFLVTGDIVQYHFSGSPTRYLKFSGSKVILDEVRKWASKQGFSWLHLGGGVGSKEDSLFRFKAGFSKLRFPFEVVRMFLEPTIYAELVQKRIEWENKNRYKGVSDDYFPLYRRPVVG